MNSVNRTKSFLLATVGLLALAGCSKPETPEQTPTSGQGGITQGQPVSNQMPPEAKAQMDAAAAEQKSRSVEYGRMMEQNMKRQQSGR